MINNDNDRLALLERLARCKAKKKNSWPICLIIIALAANSLGMTQANNFTEIQESRGVKDFCPVPLAWLDELHEEKQKLRWTQQILKQERQRHYNNDPPPRKKPSVTTTKQRAKQIIPSPFKPHLIKLARHWNYRFGLTEEEMQNYLAAILFNETGNAKRFIPQFEKQKYLEFGDGGYGCHAWQIDRRSHSKCYPMTFNKSGNYAIKAVLYPCFKRAKKKGYTGLSGLMAAATCYNSGQFNDNYSTNYYGYRAIHHFKRLNQQSRDSFLHQFQ